MTDLPSPPPPEGSTSSNKTTSSIDKNNNEQTLTNQTTITDSSSNNNNNGTRLCVKNIPPSFSENPEKLKDYFRNSSSNKNKNKQNIVITDCRVLRTKKGTSRNMAFVGFKTPDMADYVRSYFNGTYAGTSKLTIERAFSKTERVPSGFRPWSRHSVGSSRHKDGHSHRRVDDVDKVEEGLGDNTKAEQDKEEESEETKRRKEEFLSVMGVSNGQSKFWSNDDGLQQMNQNKQQQQRQISNNNDDENDKTENEEVSAPSAVMTDFDFLKSKTVDKETLVSDSEDDGDDNHNPCPPDNHIPTNNDDDDSLSSTRLFIRNLSFQTTEDELRALFQPYGPIVECRIPLDGTTNRPRGFGFVSFGRKEHAEEARRVLDGVDCQGRIIGVLRGKKVVISGEEEDEHVLSQMSYKERLDYLKRKNALSTTTGWNTSHLRSDTVVSSLSSRLSLSKSQILNIENSGGDAAVKLALGETEILRENKEFFGKEGIDMDAIVGNDNSSTTKQQHKIKRSVTKIIVKNLPHETTREELSSLFGSILSGDDVTNNNSLTIALAPSRTMALVSYDRGGDAKRAFRSLAYRRFHDVPLYLEWAPLLPEEQQRPKVTTTEDKIINHDDNEKDDNNNDNPVSDDDDDDDDDDDTPIASLYVKNLSFQTTPDELRTLFTKSPHNISVKSVTIPTKTTPKGATHSMGVDVKMPVVYYVTH